MKKRIASIILTVLLAFTLIPAGVIRTEAKGPARLIDEADVLTEKEEQKLSEKLDEISLERQSDVAVVILKDFGGKDPETFADDYYMEQGYGIGEEKDGILLMIGMSERQWHITTHGYARTAFTDQGLDYIEEEFRSSLSDGKYAKAFQKYADLCDDFLKEAAEGEPYDGKHMPKRPLSPIWILGAPGIGFVIMLIIASVKKSKLKSVKEMAAAKEYTRPGSVQITSNHDRLVNKVTTRRKIDRDDDSKGGSSSHSSSSGDTFGGSGGSF